jgi:hypothetical protein
MTEKRGRGVPKKYTQFIEDTLTECFENGFTMNPACEAAGITYQTYNRYIKDDKDFAQRMDDAQMIYKLAVKKRVIDRVDKIQEYVDELLALQVKSIKTITKTDSSGKLLETITTEEILHPAKWLIERYLPVDIKPEETNEEIVVNVNFNDDSTIDIAIENDDNYIEEDIDSDELEDDYDIEDEE